MKKALYTLCLFCVGCAHFTQTVSFADYPFYDNGRAKPKVAVVPIFDHSSKDISMEVDKLFSQTIQEKLFQSGALLFTTDFSMLTKQRLNAFGINPFTENIDWIKEIATDTEFIVFTELVSHRLQKNPSSTYMFHAYTLDIAFRVKVFDVRGSKPKVILQEVWDKTIDLPWHHASLHTDTEGLNNSGFSLSSLSRTHTQIVNQVCLQIEDYILLSKSSIHGH